MKIHTISLALLTTSQVYSQSIDIDYDFRSILGRICDGSTSATEVFAHYPSPASPNYSAASASFSAQDSYQDFDGELQANGNAKLTSYLSNTGGHATGKVQSLQTAPDQFNGGGFNSTYDFSFTLTEDITFCFHGSAQSEQFVAHQEASPNSATSVSISLYHSGSGSLYNGFVNSNEFDPVGVVQTLNFDESFDLLAGETYRFRVQASVGKHNGAESSFNVHFCVPEPSSALMSLVGLAGFAFRRRR